MPSPAGRSVIRIGVDVVGVDRFAAVLVRTPELVHRLFGAAEQVSAGGYPRRPASLAARFAAKEAVAKALGAPAGMHWHHCRVITDPSGRPQLLVEATVAAVAAGLGIVSWELSLSHDAGIAAAVVLGLG